jgi:hypothetical protein
MEHASPYGIELEKLKQQIKYYEDENKHPIKYNRQLQKQVKDLTAEIVELRNKLSLEPEPDLLIEPDVIIQDEDKFVCENPLGLEAFYRNSFSKPNPLKKS